VQLLQLDKLVEEHVAHFGSHVTLTAHILLISSSSKPARH